MSWQQIKALNEQKAALQVDMRSMLKVAETDKRDLTPDEATKFDELAAKCEGVNKQIARVAAANAGTDERSGTPGLAANAGTDERSGIPGLAAIGGGVDARTSYAHGLDVRMADVCRDSRFDFVEGRSLSIGKTLRGFVSGDWSGADLEHRAMSIGSSSAGGLLVPLPISATILDKARNASVVLKAGARTVPMTSNTLKMVRVTGDPTIGWRAENAAFASGDASYDSFTLTAKSLGGVAKMSIELAEDVAGMDQQIEDQMAKAIALELDRAALRGSGSSNQPTGLLNTSGVQTMTAVGDPTYAAFSRAVQKVREVNCEPTGVVVAPRTAGDLDRLVDSTGQYLEPPPSLRNIPFHVSNQLPVNLGTGTDESEAYVGEWSNLLLAIRSNLILEVSRDAADSDGSAFRNGQLWIRAMVRADVGVTRPNSFVVMSGITTP